MKKIYLIIRACALMLGVLFNINTVNAQTPIVAWQLYNAMGIAETSTANVIDNGLNPSVLKRGNGLTTNAGASTFNAKLMSPLTSVPDSTTAIDNNVYFEFSVSAKENYKFSLTKLHYKYRNNSTGAKTWYPKYSINGTKFYKLAEPVDVGQTNGNEVDIDDLSEIDALQNIPYGTTVYFRIYAYNTGTGNFGFGVGTAGENTVAVFGTVEQITTTPVKLGNFQGKQVTGGVQLNWKTYSENNNSHFEVLRISGGKSEKIGEVKGNGTSNTIKEYNYLDNRPLPGINYYQLRQVDFDGKTELSNVASVRYGFAGKNLNASINNGQLLLNTYANQHDTADIALSDMSGHVVFKTKTTLQKGENTLSFAVNLPKGAYVATVYSAQNGKISGKIIY